MTTRLRFRAMVNPPTIRFEALPDETPVTFVPLEGVWPGGLDTSRSMPKKSVASGYTRFLEGDVVVPKITPTFQADRATIAAGLFDGIGAGTTELHVVRCGSNVDARYVRYLFSSRPFLMGGEAELIGVAGQKRVPEAWIKDFRIPIDDHVRQRAIADYLDAQTARIDALIAAKRMLLGLLSERYARILSSSVGSDPSIPLFRLLRARITDGPHETPEFVDDGVPFLSVDSIKDGELDFEDCRYISREAHLQYVKKCRPEMGDILVTKAAGVGKVALVETESEFSVWSPLALLKPNPSIVSAEFLFYALSSPQVQYLIALASTSNTQFNLSMPDLARIRIPCPPVEEQIRIAKRLASARGRLVRTLDVARRQQGLLVEHRQALITAAVTGELDVPGVAA